MALDAELINLRSAGTYRFERDLSTISNDTFAYSNLRLVVGFSKTGPFNTPCLVTNSAEFIKLYGNIDRSLEKKGSYFHRSALVALSAGPIVCLNLVNLDPDVDQVQTRTLSVNVTDKNRSKITLPITSVYNTDKFWYVDDESLLNAIDVYLNNIQVIGDDAPETYNDSILSFTNVGKKPISILVKKSTGNSVKGFELTLADWYGEGEVPEYLNPTSYVSDYMVDVYVVSGDFGPDMQEPTEVITSVDVDDDDSFEKLLRYDETDDPYKRFRSDIVYQDYFDKDGFIRRDNDMQSRDYRLNKFLNLPSVNLLAKYTGSLIPNFTDKLGRNLWIVKLVNDNTSVNGLVCSENVEELENVDIEAEVINEKIDLIGHNLYAQIVDTGSFTKDNSTKNMKFDFLSYKMDYSNVFQTIKVRTIEQGPDVSSDGTTHYGEIVTYIKPKDSVADLDQTMDYAPFAWYRYDEDSKTVYTNLRVYTTTSYINSNTKLEAYSSSDATGDKLKIVGYSTANPLYLEIRNCENLCDSAGEQIVFYTSRNEGDDTVYTIRDNEVVLESGVTVGDYLVSYLSPISDDDDEIIDAEHTTSYSRLTRVVEVRNLYTKDAAGNKQKTHIRVICADKVHKSGRGMKDNLVVKVNPVDSVCDRLHWTCLKGFQIRKEVQPDGTNERQNQILDMIREAPWYESTTSNLFKCLIDRDYISWRYLVDTFGNGLEEECKSVYTQLCQARKSALAIVNCPSHAAFKKSTNPSFVNKAGSVVSEFVANGGDTSKNPDFLFTLPKYENGASWGAYYFPYLKISDLSAIKTVPPAAYVSNLYIQKYSKSQAWAIVAGQKRGVISGNQVIGVEATLIHDNRDYLEPAGINSIIWENGVGVEIYANKTAKQTPKSALSSIHVREACIYIQDVIETILRKYVFEYNTAQTRLEIKTLVDDFLETVKNNDGVYDYKTVMDTSNNTPEVIDNNMGIIDVYIEPVRGLEILAQRLTILKTGSIAAGNFGD